MEAYKVANDFYPELTPPNQEYTTIPGRMMYYVSYQNPEISSKLPNFPYMLKCPLGTKSATNSGGTYYFSYGIRSTLEEYTIQCFIHNNTSVTYRHLKDKPAEFEQDMRLFLVPAKLQ